MIVPNPRMLDDYRQRIVPSLITHFGFKNPMRAPQVTKVVLNIGVGEATQDIKLLDLALADLAKLSGQKPSIRRAKKSIANFKLRAGMPVGTMVTLRGKRMYEFLDRLINVAIPRIRDFRGVPRKSFDGHGNFSLGIVEHVIFPEIDRDKVTRLWGLDVTIVTSARNDEEGYELLREMGMPFVGG
jgi:large subunit ribosomal protein L5